MVLKEIRSIFVALVMGLSAYFGSLTIQCLFLWLAFISPKLFRWYIDITLYMWICSSITLMEYLSGIKFRLYGDKIISSERAVFIMNHRTRLDWLYFYAILLRFGNSLCDEKIILKNDLKKIPGPGWAMQCGSYIFLERKLDSDKRHLSNMIDYLSSVGHVTKILIFPEGTNMCQFSQDKSHQFADKMGLQRYENVLHPRTSGFVHIVEEMIRYFPDFDAVYDITAAYPDQDFATNELEFVLGKSSSEIHFNCRRYSLKELVSPRPDSDIFKIDYEQKQMQEKLKNFVTSKWNEKEKILADYYHKDFVDNRPLSFHSDEVKMYSVVLKRLISVLIICGNVFACIYALCSIPKISVPIFIVLNGIFLYFNTFQNGIDEFVMKLALKNNYRCPKAHELESSIEDSLTSSIKLD